MPRANSEDIANAFRDHRPAKCNNTTCDGERVYLHGSLIAYYDLFGVPWVSLCGWATNVTCNRVNAIVRACGGTDFFSVSQTKRYGERAWYGGRLIDPTDRFPLCGPLGALALAVSNNPTVVELNK